MGGIPFDFWDGKLATEPFDESMMLALLLIEVSWLTDDAWRINLHSDEWGIAASQAHIKSVLPGEIPSVCNDVGRLDDGGAMKMQPLAVFASAANGSAVVGLLAMSQTRFSESQLNATRRTAKIIPQSIIESTTKERER